MVNVVMYVFFAEILGVFLAKHLIEMLSGKGQLVGARYDQRVIGNIDDSFQPRHLGSIDRGGYDIAHEEQFGFGVIDNVVHLLGREFV